MVVINMRRLVLNHQLTIFAGQRFDQEAMKHKDSMLGSNQMGSNLCFLQRVFFSKAEKISIRIIVKLPCYKNVDTNSKGFWLDYAHTHSDAVLLLSESVD